MKENQVEKDLEELILIYQIFESSDRPESASEWKEAKRMEKWFHKTLDKYREKQVYQVYQFILDALEKVADTVFIDEK
jgi:hypothetical protein